MAIKAGSSHALATLVLTLLSATLIGYMNHVGASNFVFELLTSVAMRLSIWLRSASGLEVSPEVLAPGIVATVLAFVWGIVYHFVRHGRQTSSVGG